MEAFTGLLKTIQNNIIECIIIEFKECCLGRQWVGNYFMIIFKILIVILFLKASMQTGLSKLKIIEITRLAIFKNYSEKIFFSVIFCYKIFLYLVFVFYNKRKCFRTAFGLERGYTRTWLINSFWACVSLAVWKPTTLQTILADTDL